MAALSTVDREPITFVNGNQTNEHNKSYLSIPEFYVGRSVFITGGTGFMGKVIDNYVVIYCDCGCMGFDRQ